MKRVALPKADPLEGQPVKKITREKKAPKSVPAALGELIEEILVDAYGEQEQLWALRQAFEDNVALPADGSVVGGPVQVIAFDYDGNERRGLTAKRRGADGREHVVAAADVTMASCRSCGQDRNLAPPAGC
jgi:hypothetical protein